MRFAFSVLALACACSALRPHVPDVLGSASLVDHQRPHHHEFFSNGAKRSDSSGHPTLAYIVDVNENVHSVDNEPSVVGLSCDTTENIAIQVSDDRALRSWGSDFVLTASGAWGCVEGAVHRRVVGLEWASATVARAATTRASLTDIFDKAEIHFSVAQPTGFSRALTSHHWAPNLTVSWNREGNGARESPIVFSKLSCDVGCSGLARESDLCSLCPKGVELKSVVDCTDCWASATLNTLAIEIEIGTQDHTKLLDLTATLNATTEIEVGEAALRMDAAGTYTHSLPIFSAPIYGTPVSVAGTEFQLGVYFDIAAAVNVSLSEASARVGVSYSKIVDLSVTASMRDQRLATTVVMRNGNVPEAAHAAANGQVAASIGLKPNFNLKVGDFGNVEAWVEPAVSASARFSLPAFDALPTSSLRPEGRNYGRCDRPHLLEYEAGLGLKVGADAKFLDKFWPASHDVVAPVTLASGCLVNVTSRDADLHAVALEFKERVTAVIGGLRESALLSGLANEIAHALRVNNTDLLVALSEASKHVSVTIVRDDGARVAENLVSQTQYQQSALWSGPLMTQLQASYDLQPAVHSDGATGASSSAVASALVAAAGVLLAC
eukprot:m51a1_g1833 hypothetical protein (609) ;mRNA; r:544946-547042